MNVLLLLRHTGLTKRYAGSNQLHEPGIVVQYLRRLDSFLQTRNQTSRRLTGKSVENNGKLEIEIIAENSMFSWVHSLLIEEPFG